MSRPPDRDRDGELLSEEPQLHRIQLSVYKHTITLALRNLFTNTWSFYKRDSADALRLVAVSNRFCVFAQGSERQRRALQPLRGQRSEVTTPVRLFSWLGSSLPFFLLFLYHLIFCSLFSSHLFCFDLFLLYCSSVISPGLILSSHL